jgi:class 3 adenylate cyclase
VAGPDLDDRTRWARSGGEDIAYRVFGEGNVDVLFLGGFISHIEVLLEEPGLQRWFERLGRIARVILLDRRGSGMSSVPGHDDWTLDDEIADLCAVLDEVGSERVVVMAYAAGGPLAIAFAAQRPERTLALVLYAAMASSVQDEEIIWAQSHEEREARMDEFVASWGTGINLERMAPSAADDERMRAWLGRLERQSMSPTTLRRIARKMASFEVKELISAIRAPTLLLHRTGDRMIDPRHSRFLAERIAGARLVELPGEDSLPMVGDTEAILGEVELFLTGGRRGGELDRSLLTVLFTDICDATTTASRLGDARWRSLLAAHDRAVRTELERFGGVEVKTIGDAFLATFAGPPSQAVRCARAILNAVTPLGIELRAGLHTGECEHIGGDVGGMAVHIASRVAAMAAPGEVLTSGTTFGTVVGSGLSWEDRGAHQLKGVPGMWPIFALR